MSDLDSELWIEVKTNRHWPSTVKFKEWSSVSDETSNQLHSREEQEQEELVFVFDEEMQQREEWINTFTDWSDNDSDCEIGDQDLNKIFIITEILTFT